jgi:DNA mismatch repair protein MutS2
MSSSNPIERAERLAAFAAEALDWPAIREVLRPLATSALALRGLDELVPRAPEEAAAALERARELLALEREEGVEVPLSGCGDPRGVLERAIEHHRPLDGDDLGLIERFLARMEDLAIWLAARRDRLVRCGELLARLPDHRGLRAELGAKLDRKGGVRDDATPRLARLREGIAALEATIEKTMNGLARDSALRAALAEGHAGRVHRRNGRPVLAVRATQVGRVRGIVHDRSQTGDTVFVEPESVVRHANALVELEADARGEENKVLGELTRQVLLHRDTLRVTAERATELELAALAARQARSVSGCIPRLAEASAPGLVLRGFRHPLLIEQERAGRIERVVPLNLRLGNEFDLLVITGPNTGGKTLALKGAGLACLLASLGLALPAEAGTVVPLLEGIVADIGDEQEIQQSLSTFSSHLVRIRAALERAGPRTLVLLDELGGGTDPSEGAALGEAILLTLLEGRVPTVATTHLGALKEIAYRAPRVENAHVEFDVQTLSPLYELVIGAPGESRALAIAARLGLDRDLIERAEQRLGRRRDAATPLDEVRDLRLEAERLRAAAEERAVELERARTDLEAERATLEARADQLEAEAQRGIEERVAAARTLLERGRGLLDQLGSQQREAVTRLLDDLAGSLGAASLTDRRATFLQALKKGELVWLPRFKKRCQVLRVHKQKREVDVKLGAREMRVSFDDVTFYESL